MYVPGGSVNVVAPNVGLNGPHVDLNAPRVNLNGPGINNAYGGPGYVDVGLNGANAGGYSTTTTTSYRSVGPTGSYNIVQPDLNLNANSAGYNLNGPRLDLNAPRVDVGGYNMNGPRVDLNAPRLDLAAPRLDLAAPRMDLHAPRLDLAAPRVDLAAPRVDLNGGNYNLTRTSYNGNLNGGYDVNEGAQFVEQDDMTSSGCCNRRHRSVYEFGHKRMANEFAGNTCASLCCRRCCVAALIGLGLLALAGIAVGIAAAVTGGKFGANSSSSSSSSGSVSGGTTVTGSSVVGGVGSGGVGRIAGGYLGGYLVNGVLVVPITATPQRTFLIYGTEMPCNLYNNNSVTTTPSYRPNCNQVSTKIIPTTPLTTTPFRLYYPAVIGGNGLTGIISGAQSVTALTLSRLASCTALGLIVLMQNVKSLVAFV